MTDATRQPLVSIVVLNYNTADLLQTLLPFALKTRYSNFEVVVIDNASTDNSLEVLESRFPEVKVISLEKNHGFAGGYNEGLRQLKSDFWVLLNSDVEVTENWLQPLVDQLLSNPKIAAVQPKILDYYNRRQFEYAGASGGYLDRLGYPFCRGRIFDTLEEDKGQYQAAKPVFWATGAAMLVRKEAYTEAGGMDEDFFAHMEEIDLCWRFQNLGYEVWVCPEAEVYHMGGGTLSSQSTRKTFLNYRNNLAMLFKNLPTQNLIQTLLIRLVLDGVAGMKLITEMKAGHCWAIAKAHFSFYLHFRGWYAKRRALPNKKPISELYGLWRSSIVWMFFIRNRKHFSQL